MSAKGFFVLYGPPGGGKSTEATRCFLNSLHIGSSPNVLQFYKMLAAREGLPLPKREIIVDTFAVTDTWNADAHGRVRPVIQTGEDGLPVPIGQKSWLEQILVQLVRKAVAEWNADQPLTYDNLVIDEAGTFWARVFQEIVPTVVTSSGKIDTRGAYGQMAKWSSSITDYLRALLRAGMNVCLVAHEGDPDPSSGKKGGPKFPSKAIMGQLCADSDGVIMREVEDDVKVLDLSGGASAGNVETEVESKSEGPRRIWRIHASQNWLSKLRGIPDSMFEEVKQMMLEDIIKLAGYEPNPGSGTTPAQPATQSVALPVPSL